MRRVLIFLLAVLLIAAAAGAVLYFSSAWNNKGNELVTRTEEPAESFGNIKINTGTADVELIPAENGKCCVVLSENRRETHCVAILDKTLEIRAEKTGKWFDKVFPLSTRVPKVKVYLPKTEFSSLSVTTDTGDVYAPEALTFEDASVTGNTGDVKFFAAAEKELTITTQTGDIKAVSSPESNLTVTTLTGEVCISDCRCGNAVLNSDTGDITLKNFISSGDLSVTTGTGDVEVEKIDADIITVNTNTGEVCISDCRCGNAVLNSDTGDITLKNFISSGNLSVTTGTGDVGFEKIDADIITVNTNTGYVKGSVLSEKLFNAHSNAGKIDVPDSIATDKTCEIKTNTGDIIVIIEK